MVRGLQCPQNAVRARNFKIFTFSRGYCAKTLCVSGSKLAIFCTPRGLLVTPLRIWGRPLKFWPQAPLGGQPPKKFSPNFVKILGVGASFSSALNGDAQGPLGVKFWQLYLGPLPQKKIPKFRRKSTFYRVTKISHLPKISGLCGPRPPISVPKCSPIGSTSEIFRAKNRISSWPPCTQPPVRAVSYVWATTLNFGPDVQLREWTYRPKYQPPRPIATGTKRPEKNPKIRFSHKMAAKTTSGSGFRPYSSSPPSTWSF